MESVYRIVLATIFVIMHTQVWGITFEDAVFPELATSGRALAMGNAFICKVDDSSAAFYNPAGLGTVRLRHFHLTNVHLEWNKGFQEVTSGGKATDAATNFSKGWQLDGLRELLKDTANRKKITHTRVQTVPNILFRYFTTGFFFNKRSRTTIGEAEDAPFEYADRTDWGPYAALNLSLFGGVVKIGATGVLLNRHEAIGEAANDETFELEDNDYNKGLTEYVIVGGRLTLPIVWLPTFAGVIHNAGAKTFKGRAAGAPDPIKQQTDIGFSLTPQIGKLVRVHFEVNYKDMGGAHSDVSNVRKFVMGAEIDFARKFFIRFGYGDGFGSGGLGIKSKALEFDLTSYAVDTTIDDFQGNEDRRFSMSLSYGF